MNWSFTASQGPSVDNSTNTRRTSTKTVHVLTKPVKRDRPTGQCSFFFGHFGNKGIESRCNYYTTYLVVVAMGSTFHSSTPVDAPTASRLLQWGLQRGGGGGRDEGKGQSAGWYRWWWWWWWSWRPQRSKGESLWKVHNAADMHMQTLDFSIIEKKKWLLQFTHRFNSMYKLHGTSYH